mgnify:CR=1 FL=1
MSLSGNWISKDHKFNLEVKNELEGDYPIIITMPVVKEPVNGVLKNGQVANLSFEVNDKPVYVYLFVNQVSDDQIEVRGTGRSTGRFKGDIPETVFYRN